MNSPIDNVARGDRDMNGALGPWIETLKPTVELLRSFQPEVWPVCVILVTCFILAGLYPFFAASNAMLVFTVGSLACLVGSRVGQLVAWPGSTLVPRYTGSLVILCVGSVVLAILLTGLVCWSLGNPVPAVAPAMLVGAAMMRYAIRRPIAPRSIAVWWVILVLATLCGAAFDGARQPLLQLSHVSSALSHVWVQLAALAGIGLIIRVTQGAMVPSTTDIGRSALSPIGLGNFSRWDFRKGALDAASTFGMLLLIWYFFPKTTENIFMVVWICALSFAVQNWWECTVHVQLSRDWIFGMAQSRRELGRRAAARVVWTSVPWLAFGIGWSIIHAFTNSPAAGFFLKEVLLCHIAVLVMATVLCHLTRRLPPTFLGRHGIYSLLVGLGGGAGVYFAIQDYQASDYALLVLALIGAAVLTVYLGGRALAGAEVRTEVPVSRRGELR